jgi:hypothetical protein
MAFDAIIMSVFKIAGIVVISQELARNSAPSAEAIIKQDLVAAVNSFVDSAFIGTAAATASSPAGLLNGVTGVTSTGSTPQAIAKDVSAAIAGMISSGGQAASLVLLMHPSTAAQVGLTFSAGGGLGLPIITSSAVPPGRIVVLDESEVLLSDEGEVGFDISTQALVQLDTAPSTPIAVPTSLWQQNLAGVRAERVINWLARRSNAAAAGFVTGIA